MTVSPTQAGTLDVPGYQKVQRVFFAAGIAGAPLTFLGYLICSPLLRGNGEAMLAANQAADPMMNQLHLVFGVATGFLLPVSFLAMAVLTARRTPWLATIGGILGLLGWLPWAPLMALEAATYDMAQMGGGAQFAALWDRFNGDGVMTFYLLFYVICHLVSAVLLGIAMNRARVIPAWSGWALILSSPVTIAAFPLHSLALFYFVCVLLIAGSIPAGVAMLRSGPVAGPADG